MKTKFSKSGIIGFVTLCILFLSSSIISYSQIEHEASPSSLKSVNFSLAGGYAYSQSRSGMVDLKAEIQLSLSDSIKLGFGVGYLSDADGLHMSGNQGGMMGGMMDGQGIGFSGHQHIFRTVPLTLSLYYLVPLNPRADIFMVGGGGYYLSSFRDISSQNKSAFGPHVGFGTDIEIGARILVVVEGIYRFINLKDFVSELHPGFREGMEGEEHEEGFWHYHHHDQQWHFHEQHKDPDQMMMDIPNFNISLNGFSLRAGLKFSF
ncbi:MAG: hypothetical protein GTO17_00560 [Candidatus Aminicenantes bacterium]|nr:hypothetical protein [Candidatus Aminicenantes bacterium]